MDGAQGNGIGGSPPAAGGVADPPRVATFHSASGKRQHARVGIPGEAELLGSRHPLRDLSLGGFALAVAGPPGSVGDPVRVTLHLGEGALRLSLDATARIVRVQAGRAVAFQFIALPPPAASALDRLIDGWLSGDAAAALPAVMPAPSLRVARPGPQSRWIRAALLLGPAAALLAVAAAAVVTSRMVVTSEFAAVAAPLRLVRAPTQGTALLAPLAPGSPVAAGQEVARIEPILPPLIRAELEPRIATLETRRVQLQGELREMEAAFGAFQRQARADLAFATEARQLAERRLAAQERLHGRMAELSRQGLGAATRTDQEEVNLLQQRRALAEARAAEAQARLAVAEAEAGRFRADGIRAARPPAEVRRDLAAAEAELAETRSVLARLAAPVPLVSPCDCVVATLGATPGGLVAAGDAVVGLAEPARDAAAEVDALVASGRMPFLRVGQEVRVTLGGAADPVPGRIVALDYNPENAGRTGLPDNLRSLRSYGLATVALTRPAPALRTGLPAVVEAPIHLRMLLLNVPGLGWLLGLAGR